MTNYLSVFLAMFSSVVLLVSAFIGVRAELDARKCLPLQFAGELSSCHYMKYALFDRSIPLVIRRRLGVSAALAIFALAGFVALAGLAGNPIIAGLLVLICTYGVANLAGQWRSARR